MTPVTTAHTGAARIVVALLTGIAMIGLGLFVALRPLWAGAAPLAGSRWLDAAFAFFFLLRGGMNVRMALAARRARAAADHPTR